MGIDVYLRWEGQTEEERGMQMCGFSVAHGHVGYLREAYHGIPYATEVLVPEGFAAVGEPVPISAAILRERLPKATETCAQREVTIYKREPEARIVQAYVDFVELAERKEAELGKPCTVEVSY